MKEGNIPRTLENNISKKLCKVNSELEKRASGVSGDENNNANETDNSSKTSNTAQDKTPTIRTVSGSGGAADANVAISSSEEGQKQSDNLTSDMNKMSSEISALDSKTQSDNAAFQTETNKLKNTVKSNVTSIKKEQKQIKNLEKANKKIEKKIEKKQKELDKLQETGSDESKMKKLQKEIKSERKTTTKNNKKMKTSGKSIKKYTTSTGNTLTTMSKTAQSYSAQTTATQAVVQQKQESSNTVLKAFDALDQTGAKVVSVGETAKEVGYGLIAASSIPGCHGLYAPGTLAVKGGTYACFGGHALQAGANAGKSVTYLAQGNISGALGSLGKGITHAASAMSEYNDIKGGFANLKSAVDLSKIDKLDKKAANQLYKERAMDVLNKRKNGLGDPLLDGLAAAGNKLAETFPEEQQGEQQQQQQVVEQQPVSQPRQEVKLGGRGASHSTRRKIA